MKICVYGAGAVGGLMAAWLFRSGHEVSVVARGAHLEAIRAGGLRVKSGDKVETFRLRAEADPASLGPQDYVLVVVKAQSLKDVAARIGSLNRDPLVSGIVVAQPIPDHLETPDVLALERRSPSMSEADLVAGGATAVAEAPPDGAAPGRELGLDRRSRGSGEGSPVVGKTLAEIDLRGLTGASVLAIARGEELLVRRGHVHGDAVSGYPQLLEPHLLLIHHYEHVIGGFRRHPLGGLEQAVY